MPLCVQGDVEKFLQLDVTAEPEAQVTYLIENAEAQILDYLQRQRIESAAVADETFDGNGDELIQLAEWPVTAVASVVEDGNTLTVDDEYVWYPDGRIYRGTATARSYWRGGRRAVVINYTAGYATVPNTIRDVCARMVARVFQAGAAYANTPDGAEGIKSISLDGSDSIEYRDNVSDVAVAAPVLLDDEKQALNRYRKQVYV